MTQLVMLFSLLLQAFSLRVHVRSMDGQPAPGVTVEVRQGTFVAGACETDATGWCVLAFTLEDARDEPVLYLVGHDFAPVYGLHGDRPIFILWPEILTGGVVGFVVDTPGGVLQDTQPEGAWPVWDGQAPETLAALQTAAPSPTSAATSTPKPTLTPVQQDTTSTPRPSPSLTPSATRAPASVTPAPASVTPAPAPTLTPTPAGLFQPTLTPGNAVLLGIILVVMALVAGYVARSRRGGAA